MVEHITELPIVCPFCRQETLEYELPASSKLSIITESTPALPVSNNLLGIKKIKRMNKMQAKNLWNMQEQIREDSKELKISELIQKYNASYPVLKKIIAGTWRPKLGEHVGGAKIKGNSIE